MEVSRTGQGTNLMSFTLFLALLVRLYFSTSSAPAVMALLSVMSSDFVIHSQGLSLLGYPGLDDIDPVYCMPASLIEAKGLKKDWEALPRRT